MFSSGGRKDSLRNAEESGVFTASLASRHLAEQVNASSVPVPYGADEFAIAGLSPAMGNLVDAPYVSEAYTVLECRVTEIIQPKALEGSKTDSHMVFGQVVGIHISDEVLRDGRIDMSLLRPIARMGYHDYSDGGADVFQMTRPNKP